MRQLFIIFILLPFVSFGQYDSEEDVKTFLASSQYKIWVYDDFKISMKGSDSCEKGETYTFFSDGKLLITRCLNGQWKEYPHNYSLRKESPFDWWITFNNEEYYMVMINRSYEHELKLRKGQEGKSDPTKDIILIYKTDD